MTFFYIILGIILGSFFGFIAAKSIVSSKGKKLQQLVDEAEAKAKKLTAEAETKEKEVLIKAKDKAVKILEDARLEEKRALEELKKQQNALSEKENVFGTKLLEIEDARKDIEIKNSKLLEDQQIIEQMKQDESVKLEEVAGLNQAEAQERLLKLVEEQSQETLMSRVRKLEQMESEEIDRKAKNILAVAIQRLASSTVVETTTTNVELPSDEMKGRIIGREGRNIKALELLTGCELIVDDTPGMITISGFSPIRRHVAKRALDKLIADGRIHPGRIEEAVEEAKKELALDIKKAGEDALFQLGIGVAGIDPKLVQILGRLKYRTSHGQNQLQHSTEVANLASLMAEQLGADVTICKKGGLFHDIGKAVDHDLQGGHPELGYQILKKFGFPEEICYQSLGHHEDKPKTLEAVIVKAADAISGARPGARKESLEFYIKRLEELENLAAGFEGVEKVYAIQAGREIRVFVNPKEMDDFGATKLAREVAAKIEQELKYPGEVRVTLIRETRIIEYAR
ncbi:ribonuclease Y [Patescibacteria group bacterium]|nr:ribonuclease Y [Patescibacteria group bacterium]MBU1629622.1 ribonuclease Y [Patescibacteria group bacterium]MBU1908067.1 ribonuclease Y [Patescibacteria group bacterium]